MPARTPPDKQPPGRTRRDTILLTKGQPLAPRQTVTSKRKSKDNRVRPRQTH